ncbi:MAG: AbrB/MazE/SpoVT family DNA-binding domain-containing protein [Terracidiphilus sp.]|jgi:AbrB family looped-hinge helix DNA binding protein
MDATVKPGLQAKTKLSPNGRIVIPAAIRDELEIKPGESLLMEVEDGVLRIESYRSRIRRIQKEFAHLVPPGRCVSDELIAERRQEALLEQEDFERARELRRIRDGYQSQENKSREDQPQTSEPPESQVA